MGQPTPPVYRDAASAGSIPASSLMSLACDVGFISDHSTPPHVMVTHEIERLQNSALATPKWAVR